MGIIYKFFKSADIDYTSSNDNVYNIRKDPEDLHKVEVWFNGKKDITILDVDVLIRNEQLASGEYYKYFFKDNFQEMAECKIHKSGEVWYISCNTWSPVDVGQLPDRMPFTGFKKNWFSHQQQVFISDSYETDLEVLTTEGEYKKIRWLDVTWVGEVRPTSKFVWYLATVDQLSEDSYTITVNGEVMSDVDVIVNGKMVWNKDILKWEIKE